MRHYLSIFLIFISFSSYAQNLDCQTRHCVAVVDAGSTGSRLHVYDYDLSATNTPININERWVKKLTPGFATLDTNPSVINKYLDSLFTDFPDRSMPVYFYATGGMRMIAPSRQKVLYTYLQDWFTQAQLHLAKAKTITGDEEGLYDWLSVNYQTGALQDSNKPTAGVMDIGGASVQIAFATQQVSALDNQAVDLYGHHWLVYTHSFLGLGQTEMSHQFLDNPACFPVGYPMPDGGLGTGDGAHCEEQVANFINQVHDVNTTVKPILMSNLEDNWYILGGASDVAKSKPFNASGQFDSATLFDQAQQSICSQSWVSLTTQYPGNDYLYGYCLFPAYYYALLVDGYGINNKMAIHLMDSKQTADWTLGVVLKN